MKTNKVMLITGATSGVGKALAEHYYKKLQINSCWQLKRESRKTI